MFNTTGLGRLRGPAQPANVPSSIQSRNAHATMEAVAGHPAIPTKYPQVANPSKGWFPMLATMGCAQPEFAPSHHARLQIYTGLPPLVIVPDNLRLKDSFKLFPDKASEHDTIHLEFQGKTLTIRNAMETVKNAELNGAFTLDQGVIDAIAQYRGDIAAGKHPPFMMLIGIPACLPQVYAPLSLNIAGKDVDPEGQRLHVVKGKDTPPRQSRAAAPREGSNRLMLRPATASGHSPRQPRVITVSASSDADWSLPQTVRGWTKRELLSSAWYEAAPPFPRESVNWTAVHDRMYMKRGALSDAGTSARRAAGISIVPADSQLPERAQYPLFAESTREDMVLAARGVLILLDREQQEELVKHLQQVRRDLSRLDHAMRTGEQPSIESCQSRLEQSVSLFLGMHASHDLLGLTRCKVPDPDPCEFARSERFRTFVDCIIKLHKALCTARITSDTQFAPPEFGDTQYQIKMETGAANNAADKLLHLASAQAGK
ncbi:hypothetical protein [Noviherbaspirillum malthae]|uniref:hypothetical protein n=1 Tax=Noviherbaspirillum malthae TaxID=1260987 RepID=UPI00188EB66D|nr:hypothetical protein [Noviherbaspirillum malthae]